MLPPAILAEEIPLSERAAMRVERWRREIEACLAGRDPRLVVIAGPCSIHDPAAALDFAAHLADFQSRYPSLLLVMRTYFEKPRTTVGWKGLINDPDRDETFNINKGLRQARTLLAELAETGLPTATEFLDMSVPQHIADLLAWAAIGARTVESQTHRELASGVSVPVGFKNATTGDVKVAVDAVRAARSPHWFPGTTKHGVSAILQTTGNDATHIILRGGSRTGPNFEKDHVERASKMLADEGLPSRVMVDLSHGNSLKNHLKQIDAADDVARQLGEGDSPIFGVMVEANLVEGRQDARPGEPLVYGQSITDACVSVPQLERILRRLDAR